MNRQEPPISSSVLKFTCTCAYAPRFFFFFFLMIGRPPSSTLFPYTPLSRSDSAIAPDAHMRHRRLNEPDRRGEIDRQGLVELVLVEIVERRPRTAAGVVDEDVEPAEPIGRSEEHTSELQSPCNLVCRLLLDT